MTIAHCRGIGSSIHHPVDTMGACGTKMAHLLSNYQLAPGFPLNKVMEPHSKYILKKLPNSEAEMDKALTSLRFGLVPSGLISGGRNALTIGKYL